MAPKGKRQKRSYRKRNPKVTRSVTCDFCSKRREFKASARTPQEALEKASGLLRRHMTRRHPTVRHNF